MDTNASDNVRPYFSLPPDITQSTHDLSDVKHIEERTQRSVYLRCNPADIGVETIQKICRWYTYGQTVHQIVRRINHNRPGTDSLSMIDVYAILAKKVEAGLVSEHHRNQLAEDEMLPLEFLDFYRNWQEWKGERWYRNEKPELNQKAIRAVNRSLQARSFTEQSVDDEQAKEAVKKLEEKEAEYQDKYSKINFKSLAKFVELERKYPVLKLGKRLVSHNRIAFLVYGDDIELYDKKHRVSIAEQELIELEAIEQEEIEVKPDEWLTPDEQVKREDLELRKVDEALPIKTQEALEMIDQFVDDFDWGGLDTPDEVEKIKDIYENGEVIEDDDNFTA